MDQQFIDSVDQIYFPKSFQKKSGQFFFDPKRTQYFSLARYAMVKGIEALNLYEGDSILIPSFICRDFLAPFYIKGIQVKFYDIDENLKLVPETLSEAKAIVCVNYFGLPQDLSPFRQYCNKNKAWLIEDNAHGFLSRDESGQFLGKRGDIGIFSLRKTIPIYNGAALSLNHPSLKKSIHTQTSFQESPSNSFYSIKRNMASLGPMINGKNIQLMTSLLRRVKKLLKGHEIPPDDEESEFKIPGTFSPCYPENLLSFLDQKNEIRRRRYLFQRVEELLAHFEIRPLSQSLGAYTSPYSYPFTCEDAVFEKVKIFLRKFGLEAFTWPSLPNNVKNSCPEFYHKVRFVRFLW
ncbi:DegT/DnrJ/EryC1/StrS family aminotransferase [Bacteriovoracales bacterium]|nr:DegT/DnrJ/EryC1/StrS family aminotransferase [Bacteriovoracales bacterium]